MWRQTVKSALLIDFDNIVGAVGREFGQKIPNWLAWLEDGQFADKKKRRFLTKRVYWNAHNEVYRTSFEENDFEAISCPSIVKNKSAADMIIALDAMKSAYGSPSIEEYIVLTTDTDFVPLLDALGSEVKQTVSAGNRNNLSYEVYLDHADFVIALDALKEAFSYQRSLSFRAAAAQKLAGLAKGARSRIIGAFQPPAREKVDEAKSPPQAVAEAAEHVTRRGKEAPGLPISRVVVNRELEKHMPGFRKNGPSAYLGFGSYEAMLREIVKGRPHLRLHAYGNGGVAISYHPEN